MKNRTIFLKGTKEGYLFVRTFEPKGTIKGVVHVLHGMGEYGERYADFARFLTSQGFALVAHDHRGQGKSLSENQAVGILKKTDTLFSMVDDVECVQDYIQGRYQGIDVFLLGHSMGSMICRYYLARYEPRVKKAIIMGTLPIYSKVYIKLMRFVAFMVSFWVSSKKRHKLLANMLNGGLNKQIDQPKTSFDWLSQDDKIVKQYIEDDLCGYAYNKRFYRSFFKLIDAINDKATVSASPQIPLLFISGEMDPLNEKGKALNSVFSFYQDHKADMHVVPNARHEVLNELNKEETYQFIFGWLNNKEA